MEFSERMLSDRIDQPPRLAIPIDFGSATPSLKILARCVRIFSTILAYQRLGARSEHRSGGRIPKEELRSLLSGWSREVLPLLNVEVQRIGAHPPLQTPAVLVGNHLGYLDIPVLWNQVPTVLIAKAEIARWPLFGAAGRRAGMVFVQREFNGSRQQAAVAIAECLRTRGLGLGLFPSGTTSIDEARPWRSGAFRIAKEAGFPVQPFRLSYDPMVPAAFVGRDYLVPHLYRLLKSPPILATIEFGAPRQVHDPDAAAAELWNWSRQGPGA